MGVVQLVAYGIWDAVVVGSSPATHTLYCESSITVVQKPSKLTTRVRLPSFALCGISISVLYLLAMQKRSVRLAYAAQRPPRPWCNGSMSVSKTVGRGSNPLGRAMKVFRHIAQLVRAPH